MVSSSAGKSFLPIAGQQSSNKYQSLIVEGESVCPSWLSNLHRSYSGRKIHEIGCYVFNDLVVTGRGHLFWNGEHQASAEFMPKYWLDLIRRGVVDLEAELNCDEIYIDDPCVVFLGHGGSVYGHFLLEMLLRLQIVSSLGLANMKLLLYDKLAPWALSILKNELKFKDDQIIFYQRDTERVRLRTAIVPTMLHIENDFHPFANELKQDLYSKLVLVIRGDTPDRICISRRNFRNLNSVQRHNFQEEQAWEYAVRSCGFSLVSPENLPWSEQLRIFANASVVLGQYGSALHNALFCSSRAFVLSVGCLNLQQSAIGALRTHRQAYLVKTDPDGLFGFDSVRSWLSRCMERLTCI